MSGGRGGRKFRVTAGILILRPGIGRTEQPTDHTQAAGLTAFSIMFPFITPPC